jgi:hypothetical protein
MRNTLLSIVLIVTTAACTRVVQAPAAAPKAPQNHAQALVELVTPLKAQGFKCEPWTGTGTAFPGVDAYLCVAPTTLIWCGAPTDRAPGCTPAVDWTPPSAQPTGPAQTKTDPTNPAPQQPTAPIAPKAPTKK